MKSLYNSTIKVGTKTVRAIEMDGGFEEPLIAEKAVKAKRVKTFVVKKADVAGRPAEGSTVETSDGTKWKVRESQPLWNEWALTCIELASQN